MVPYWSCLLWYSSCCHIPSALELLESGIERVLSFGVTVHSQASHYDICSGLLIFLAGLALAFVTRRAFYCPMHSGINRSLVCLPSITWLFSSHCSHLLPVPMLMHWAFSFGTSMSECGFKPPRLLSDGGEEVKDELLYVESISFFPH